jgi:hypothetical protein
MVRNLRGALWMFVLLAAVSGILPFIPERVLGAASDLRIFGAPVLWLVAFWGASHFDREPGRRYRWLWLAAPFAFRYVAELIAMLLFGLITGDKL